jgi:LmbE family N-acetylglucosaminyl deacetylase
VGDDELWSSIQHAVGQADTVLVPGFPLGHEDHLRLARATLARGFEGRRVGLYVEQPYAAVRAEPPRVLPKLASLVAEEVEWQALNAPVAARLDKVRAWRAYRSQFQHFGYRSLVNVLRYEARYGGEMTTLL